MVTATLNDVVMRLALCESSLILDRQTDFQLASADIRKKLREILMTGTAKSDKVGDLTRAELNAMIAQALLATTNFMDGWKTSYTKWVQDFIETDFEVTTDAYYAASHDGELPTKKKKDDWLALMQSEGIAPIYGWATTFDPDRLRSKIWNDPSGANGLVIPDFLNGFGTSAASTVVNRIRQAWANNESAQDLIDGSVGTSSQGTTSSVDRIVNQGRTVIDTTTHQAAQQTAAQAGSSITDRYMWCSVMDGRTTALCISLNMRIFIFGQGPLPPAHMNCRSHILPLLQ